MSQSSFLELLDARESCYRKVLSCVEQCGIPDDVKAEISQEMLYGRLGLEGLLQAVAKLKDWSYTGGNTLYETAIGTAKNSTKLLNQAMTLNWRSYKTLQESTEEYLEQVGYDGPE